MCLGVLGGPLGVSRDYLGCPWSSWDIVEGPWGILEKSGTPEGDLEIIKTYVFLFFGGARASTRTKERRRYENKEINGVNGVPTMKVIEKIQIKLKKALRLKALRQF